MGRFSPDRYDGWVRRSDATVFYEAEFILVIVQVGGIHPKVGNVYSAVMVLVFHGTQYIDPLQNLFCTA